MAREWNVRWLWNVGWLCFGCLVVKARRHVLLCCSAVKIHALVED